MGRRLRAGLTLMELVVVLLVLAVMTTIAVRSTESVVQQARYEATQRGLQNLREALIGAENERDADGTLLITGFVADNGRLPRAVGVDPATQLAELWSQQALPPFGFQPAKVLVMGELADNYRRNEILVPAGWRGPYVRLPIGSAELRDGWSNHYQLTFVDDHNLSIQSLGSDNAVDGVVYAADTGVAVTNAQSTATIRIKVRLPLDATTGDPVDFDTDKGDIVLKCFAPNPDANIADPNTYIREIAGVLQTGSSTSSTKVFLVDVTSGPRVFRAYQVESPTGNNNDTVHSMSEAIQVLVRPGGGQEKTIVIPKPS